MIIDTTSSPTPGDNGVPVRFLSPAMTTPALRELHLVIATNLEKCQAAAHEAIVGQERDDVHGLKSIRRRVGVELTGAFNDFTAAAAKIADNYLLSPDGQAAELKKAAAVRDTMKAQALARLDGLRAMAKPTFGAPTAAAMAEAQIILAGFSVTMPETLMADAVALLECAVDPSHDAPTRFHANTILRLAYRPAMERRAKSPEAFAEEFATRAAEILALIDDHFSAELDLPRWEQATAWLKTLRAEAKWLEGASTGNGGFDPILLTGAPTLFRQ